MSEQIPEDRSLSEEMPEVLETRLDNGMRVVSLSGESADRSDLVVLQVKLMTGSAIDGDLPGLAKFVASTATRGSAGKSLDEISDTLDGLGASIGIGAGRLTTDGSAKMLREVADEVVAMLAQALRTPDFPTDQVEIVRGQMLSGLRQRENSTRSVASRRMREAMYPEGHPLHLRAGGNQESLAAIAPDDLKRFHAENFRPDRAIVAVAGGISHEGAVQLVERHFGDWVGSPPDITVPRVEPPPSTIRVDATLAGKSQADISIGIPAIHRSHPDFYALSIANLILGRFGLYGRFGESIRERQGLAYYAFSSYQAGRETGAWTATAGVAPENVERAIDSIIAEIRTFNEGGPTEREFADSTGSILGSLPIALETSASKAGTAADIAFYDLGHDFLRRYRDIVRALTPEDITRAAVENIDPDRLIVSVAAPE